MAENIIHGSDTRRDVDEEDIYAMNVVLIIHKNCITKVKISPNEANENMIENYCSEKEYYKFVRGDYTLNEFCGGKLHVDEKFHNQPVVGLSKGVGTGFYVGRVIQQGKIERSVPLAPGILVTAGHVVHCHDQSDEGRKKELKETVNVRNLYFVQGYHMLRHTKTEEGVVRVRQVARTIFDPDWVSKGDRILFCKYSRSKNVDFISQNMDVAVIQTTPILKNFRDVKVYNGRVEEDDSLGIYVLGHPTGLPLKWCSGHVKKTRNFEFEANLDTFGGNSGSPLFYRDSDEIIGIYVRGCEWQYIKCGDSVFTFKYNGTPRPKWGYEHAQRYRNINREVLYFRDNLVRDIAPRLTSSIINPVGTGAMTVVRFVLPIAATSGDKCGDPSFLEIFARKSSSFVKYIGPVIKLYRATYGGYYIYQLVRYGKTDEKDFYGKVLPCILDLGGVVLTGLAVGLPLFTLPPALVTACVVFEGLGYVLYGSSAVLEAWSFGKWAIKKFIRWIKSFGKEKKPDAWTETETQEAHLKLRMNNDDDDQNDDIPVSLEGCQTIHPLHEIVEGNRNFVDLDVSLQEEKKKRCDAEEKAKLEKIRREENEKEMEDMKKELEKMKKLLKSKEEKMRQD